MLRIIIPPAFKKNKNEKADIIFRYTLAALLILQQHGGEILTILYLTIVTGLEPTAKSMIKSFIVFCGYFVIVYIFNLLTDINYMFLMTDTPHRTGDHCYTFASCPLSTFCCGP